MIASELIVQDIVPAAKDPCFLQSTAPGPPHNNSLVEALLWVSDLIFSTCSILVTLIFVKLHLSLLLSCKI